MSQFAKLIEEAKKPAAQEEPPQAKAAPKKRASAPVVAQDEEAVNPTIKVPISSRRHWAAEAKRTGITLTDVITEALNRKFGAPPQISQ